MVVQAQGRGELSVHLLGLILHQPDLLDHLLDLVPQDAEERELDERHHAEADDKQRVAARPDPVGQRHDAARVVVPVRPQG